jgi:hypothetical protein
MKEKEKVNFLSNGLAAPKRKLTHSEQLALYADAKQRQQRVAQWMLQHAPDLVKQQQTLTVCASLLIFHHYYRLNKHLLRGGITCKQHLLCAPCSLRRSASYAKAYFRAVQHLLKEHPDWAPVLITKTVRNTSDLGGQFRAISAAHAKLMLRRRHALDAKTLRIKNPTIYAAFQGGVGSYEFKIGKNSKQSHLHSHELAFIRTVDWQISPVREERWRKVNGERKQVTETVWKPLEIQSRLREEWKKILKDGSWHCDVRMVAWGPDGLTGDNDVLFCAVAEVMGYCLKMQEMSPLHQVYAYRVLRRRRLTYTYGALRNVELPDEAVDADDIPADEPWVELIYRWWADRAEYSLAEPPRQPADSLLPSIQSVPKKDKAEMKRKTGKDAPAASDMQDIIDNWIAGLEGAK